MAYRDWGSKPGSGGMASAAQEKLERRDRLRRLAMDSADLDKDPYLLRNHEGTIDCRLCGVTVRDEAAYMSHTAGKRHTSRLAERAAKEAARAPFGAAQPAQQAAEAARRVAPRRRDPSQKIGRPGYQAAKQYDRDVDQHALLFQLDFPRIAPGVQPRHRFMSAYEQRIEAPNRNYQYLLVAAEPYETVAFKIPSREVDRERFTSTWDADRQVFTIQLYFREKVTEIRDRRDADAPPLPEAVDPPAPEGEQR